jgi:Periplasmic binding protein
VANAGRTAAAKRTWRRLRRRSTATQVGALVFVVVLIAGVSYAATSSGSGSGKSSGGGSLTVPSVPVAGVDQASTSTRGVSANEISVGFPVSNLASLSSNFGFAGDAEYAQQVNAIKTFVNAINAAGGINGRQIKPVIMNFDPTDEAGTRALCKQFTEGSPPVFAVIDGVGAWTGDNELCVTQEGHTPFIGEWSTVSSWTNEGAPYMWWTGADQAAILATVVSWGQSSGLLGAGRKVAVVAGDRTSDQVALNDYLLPYMQRAGLPRPMVETIPSGVTNTAATNAAAPLVVQRLKAAGVQSVIPLMPFNSFFPYLGQELTQRYYPKLLLSDYESSIEVTLGLIPVPDEKALEGQEGVTAETLGGTDAPKSIAPVGGYDPGVASCYKTWHAHNGPVPGGNSPYIEEQGPIAGWCQAIRVFAAAAEKAGPGLNRRSFVQAMATIQGFAGTYSPILSYGPDRFAGPTQYQVVELHNNVPPSSLCEPTWSGKPQGTCWVVVQSWKPLAGP